MTRPLVLFLGNSILADDRIGLVIGETLKDKLSAEGNDVEVIEKTGFSLIDYLEGRERVVIVDSVKTSDHKVGDVVALGPEDFQSNAPFTSHYAGIPESIELMKRVDIEPPRDFSILGIQVEDPYTVSLSMSEKLQRELPKIALQIHESITTSALEHFKRNYSIYEKADNDFSSNTR
jgi:hydrogenase maturation protease